VLCLWLGSSAAVAASAGGRPVREKAAGYRALRPVLLEIQKRELAHLIRAEAARAQLADAGWSWERGSGSARSATGRPS